MIGRTWRGGLNGYENITNKKVGKKNKEWGGEVG